MLGFAFCGSFCSFKACLLQFDALVDAGYDIVPIMSENAYSTDTRFYAASDFVKRVEEKAGRRAVHTIAESPQESPFRVFNTVAVRKVPRWTNTRSFKKSKSDLPLTRSTSVESTWEPELS